MTNLTRSREVVLAQFLEGINQASGASSLLIHHQQNIQWMKMRDILEAVKGIVVAQAVEPMMKPKAKPMELAK